MTSTTQVEELLTDVYCTQDFDDIPSEGLVFFHDLDFQMMALWKDGKSCADCLIRDFTDEKEMVIQPGQSWDDFFTLVKAALIKEAIDEEWI